jgi:hypothetical protein
MIRIAISTFALIMATKLALLILISSTSSSASADAEQAAPRERTSHQKIALLENGQGLIIVIDRLENPDPAALDDKHLASKVPL